MPTILDDILETFVQDGILAREKLDTCRQMARKESRDLAETVIEEGLLTEEEILAQFGRKLGMPFVENLSSRKVAEEFINSVPLQFARRNVLVGLQNGSGAIEVATCSPLDLHPLDDLGGMLKHRYETVLAPRSQILSLINQGYPQGAEMVDEMLEDIGEDDISSLAGAVIGSDDLLDVANKAPVIRLVNTILGQANRHRASDVHIQPYEDKVVVRYRIDGMLYDFQTLPKRVQEAIISRVKVMGRMDIAERRYPQDGRDTVRVSGHEIDLRISCVPTSHGERVVLRFLDKSASLFRLEELGMEEELLEAMNRLIRFSHGIVLVTGPTGSGKTTTLYAALDRINTREKNIMTIEDPIEYQLAGISQMQVNEKKGLLFAEGLRSLLRQDPDVMMVGEIRDRDTAAVAIQCSLTGHLVFSTMHTNDAPSAVTRILDIGIEPYLVSSSVIAVLAQRLIRRVCPNCTEMVDPDPRELSAVSLTREELPGGKLAVGRGCDACRNTGYFGRTGIYELMSVDDIVREQVMKRAGASEIKQGCVERGMRTLRMNGAEKIKRGISTIEEVLRVTQMDLL